MKVFPERDGNYPAFRDRPDSRIVVRMKVFPERDGNDNHDLFQNFNEVPVRMKVFPERDGNWEAQDQTRSW